MDEVPDYILSACRADGYLTLSAWFRLPGGGHSDPDAVDRSGWTCLMRCAQYNSLDCMRHLLELGADVNYLHPDGFGALHVACTCCRGASDVIDLLLSAGADVDAKDTRDDGWVFGRTSDVLATTPLGRLLGGGRGMPNRNEDYESDLRGPLRSLLRYGATLDEAVGNESADVYLYMQIYRDRLRSRRVPEYFGLVSAVRKAGSWKHYVLGPHKALLRLRSLVARGRATATPETPRAVALLLSARGPDEICWQVFQYWRETT